MKHIIFCLFLLLYVSLNAQSVYLGIYVNDITSTELKNIGINYGILIETVMPGSPADIYGLQDNDIIYKINDTLIKQENDLIRFLSTRKPNDSINVHIYHNKKRFVRQIHLIERDNLFKDLYIYNYIHNPWLFIGINVEPLSSNLAKILSLETGMVILEIRDNSLAQLQGLEAGDIIISVNESLTFNERTLTNAMNKALQDQPMRISIWRESKYITVNIDLGNSLSEHNKNSNEIYIIAPDIFDTELYNYSREKINNILKKSKNELENDIERLENEIFKLRQRVIED